MIRPLLVLLFSLLFLSSCTTSTSGGSTGTGVDITAPGPAEKTYCSTTYTPSTPITVTGTAEYKRREITGDQSTVTKGLGAAGSGHPIRFAEIRITDASGVEVQCGETDINGAFSLTVPQGNVTYTIAVRSRSNNSSRLIASVLNSPDKNEVYELTTTFNGSSSTSVGTFTADVTGAILGGAFNILDQLYLANEYLRSKAGSCSSFTGCPNFTVASKVSAYWKPGFNPNNYLGKSGGISFYLPGYDRLFILGGINGDTDNTDTDHFDNSVILHEYGHFLEDNEFVSDSPGGSHSGTSMIDPRLAWSEGWGNFFQAAVQGSPYYIDTIGNIDGSTDFAFFIDLELASNGADLGHDHLDAPSEQDEGVFREFSVTRFLYDVVDTPADSLHGGTDNVTDRFVELWAVLKKSTNGFNQSNAAFRNAGNMTMWQSMMAGSTSLTDQRLIEYQPTDNTQYGKYIATGSSCSAYTFSPKTANGPSLTSSNYLRNNDFYHLKVTSTGSYTILLNFSASAGATSLSDLDIYLYNEDARIGTQSDIVGYSWDDNKETDNTDSLNQININDPQTETITVTLSPGNYLLQVNVYKSALGSLGATDYTLKLNGSALCPTAL